MPNVYDVQSAARKRINSAEVGMPPEETRGGGLPLSAEEEEKKRKKKKGGVSNPLDLVKRMPTESLKRQVY